MLMTLLDERTRRALFSLPQDERAALADALIASLDDTPDVPEDVHAAWSSEIRRRITDLAEGRAKTIPGDEARAQIQEARAAHREAWETARRSVLTPA